eukprot:scaffold6721_cov51-Attheya_sp.AAC.2
MEKDTCTPPLLPDFSRIQPHHFQEAEQILLERDLVLYHAWKKDVTRTILTTPVVKDASHHLEEEEDGVSILLHELLDQWEAPRECLIQMVLLMLLMHCQQIPLQPWKLDMSLLRRPSDICPLVYQALQNAEQQLLLVLSTSKNCDESKENKQKQYLWAIQKRLHVY